MRNISNTFHSNLIKEGDIDKFEESIWIEKNKIYKLQSGTFPNIAIFQLDDGSGNNLQGQIFQKQWLFPNASEIEINSIGLYMAKDPAETLNPNIQMEIWIDIFAGMTILYTSINTIQYQSLPNNTGAEPVSVFTFNFNSFKISDNLNYAFILRSDDPNPVILYHNMQSITDPFSDRLFNQVYAYNGFTGTPPNWSVSSAVLRRVDFGLTFEDVTDDVKIIGGMERNKEIVLNKFHTGNLTIQLDNSDNKYSTRSTVGFFNGIDYLNKRVVVHSGIADRLNQEMFKYGTFYIDTLQPDVQDKKVQIPARDKSKLLNEKLVNVSNFVTNVTKNSTAGIFALDNPSNYNTAIVVNASTTISDWEIKFDSPTSYILRKINDQYTTFPTVKQNNTWNGTNVDLVTPELTIFANPGFPTFTGTWAIGDTITFRTSDNYANETIKNLINILADEGQIPVNERNINQNIVTVNNETIGTGNILENTGVLWTSQNEWQQKIWHRGGAICTKGSYVYNVRNRATGNPANDPFIITQWNIAGTTPNPVSKNIFTTPLGWLKGSAFASGFAVDNSGSGYCWARRRVGDINHEAIRINTLEGASNQGFTTMLTLSRAASWAPYAVTYNHDLNRIYYFAILSTNPDATSLYVAEVAGGGGGVISGFTQVGKPSGLPSALTGHIGSFYTGGRVYLVVDTVTLVTPNNRVQIVRLDPSNWAGGATNNDVFDTTVPTNGLNFNGADFNVSTGIGYIATRQWDGTNYKFQLRQLFNLNYSTINNNIQTQDNGSSWINFPLEQIEYTGSFDPSPLLLSNTRLVYNPVTQDAETNDYKLNLKSGALQVKPLPLSSVMIPHFGGANPEQTIDAGYDYFAGVSGNASFDGLRIWEAMQKLAEIEAQDLWFDENDVLHFQPRINITTGADVIREHNVENGSRVNFDYSNRPENLGAVNTMDIIDNSYSGNIGDFALGNITLQNVNNPSVFLPIDINGYHNISGSNFGWTITFPFSIDNHPDVKFYVYTNSKLSSFQTDNYNYDNIPAVTSFNFIIDNDLSVPDGTWANLWIAIFDEALQKQVIQISANGTQSQFWIPAPYDKIPVITLASSYTGTFKKSWDLNGNFVYQPPIYFIFNTQAEAVAFNIGMINEKYYKKITYMDDMKDIYNRIVIKDPANVSTVINEDLQSITKFSRHDLVIDNNWIRSENNRAKLAKFFLSDLRGVHSILNLVCDFRPQYQIGDLIYIHSDDLFLKNLKTEIIKIIHSFETRSTTITVRTIDALPIP